jgi:HSP20 family protein
MPNGGLAEGIISDMPKSYDEILDDIEREMRRISDDMLVQIFRLHSTTGEVWSPRVDIYETKDKLVVKVCAAGVKPDNLDISLSPDDHFLTIRGVRSEGNMLRKGIVRYYQLEVYYGPFERVIPLPDGVKIDSNRLHAAYKEGFIIITLPKKESEEVRRVPISD